MQIATKCGDDFATGKMLDARKWLNDPNPAGNPEVHPDKESTHDSRFSTLPHGTSITIIFDQTTHPKDLSWSKANTAATWHKILSVKTGLGAFTQNTAIAVQIDVIDKEGGSTSFSKKGIEYLWPHEIAAKAAAFTDLLKTSKDLFNKKGPGFTMPSSLTNLDLIYDIFDSSALSELISFEEADNEILSKHKPTLYFAYAYSTKLWASFNESLGIRTTTKLLTGGIQIAANNMPQGEVIQIPLTKNIGVQNQVHIYIHFEDCSADLGRKGFQSEIVEFAKETSKKLVYGPLTKFRRYLKPSTGAAPDLKREDEVDTWKEQMVQYEQSNPLIIQSDSFFLPTKTISLTSTPTREQDVIALFNQLLAAGIIRGIRIMATNERLTYDSLYRVVIEEPRLHHIFNRVNNPLGISNSTLSGFETLPFKSKHPKILEYKFSLDGLIEDLDTGVKNAKDIDLVVVWETGKQFEENYKIASLMDENNLDLRQYHGVTHVMTNLNTGAREMDLIVLSELIQYLNDPVGVQQSQRAKYED
jgi:hypothetical protein